MIGSELCAVQRGKFTRTYASSCMCRVACFDKLTQVNQYVYAPTPHRCFFRFVVTSIWCRANDAKCLVPVVQHGKPPQQRQTEHTQTHKTHTSKTKKTMLCHSFLGSSSKISSDSERHWLLQGQRGDIPRLTGNQID